MRMCIYICEYVYDNMLSYHIHKSGYKYMLINIYY